MASKTVTITESLAIHPSNYSPEELLLGADVADELNLGPDDFVELRAITVAERDLSAADPSMLDVRDKPLVLRAVVLGARKADSFGTATAATTLSSSPPAPPRRSSAKLPGGVRVSLLRLVADAFALTARQSVALRRVSVRDAALDWVELSFKDQQLTRGDIWHFRRQMIDGEPTFYVGKTLALAGIRAQVYKMVMNGRQAAAGVLTEQTKLRFRSRSAAFVLLIQVSKEMGEFDMDGEMFYEKAIIFLTIIIQKVEGTRCEPFIVDCTILPMLRGGRDGGYRWYRGRNRLRRRRRRRDGRCGGRKRRCWWWWWSVCLVECGTTTTILRAFRRRWRRRRAADDRSIR